MPRANCASSVQNDTDNQAHHHGWLAEQLWSRHGDCGGPCAALGDAVRVAEIPNDRPCFGPLDTKPAWMSALYDFGVRCPLHDQLCDS